MQKHKGWVRYTELDESGRPTIGELAAKRSKSRIESTHCAQEQVDEELKEFLPNLYKNLELGKKHHDGDFFILVLPCMDQVIEGNKKNIFVATPVCPKPFYDQILYKYTKKDGHLKFIWVVPDIDLCNLYKHRLELVPDDEKELHEHIKNYHDGTYAKYEYLERQKLKNKKLLI